MELYENLLKVEKTKYKIVSQKIKISLWIVEIAGIYAACVLSTWKHGQKLVESFEQVEIHSEIDKKTYHQLRRTIVISIFLSILAVILTLNKILHFQR